jgi:hypothetical protein
VGEVASIAGETWLSLACSRASIKVGVVAIIAIADGGSVPDFAITALISANIRV